MLVDLTGWGIPQPDSSGKLSDYEFSKNIGWLHVNGFIEIPERQLTRTDIPSWFKDPTGWWSDGLITDSEYIDSVKYLINHCSISFDPDLEVFAQPPMESDKPNILKSSITLNTNKFFYEQGELVHITGKLFYPGLVATDESFFK